MTSLLPTTARALRLELARAQVAGRLPSLVAGVCRDGALTWCEGYGEVPGAPDDVQYRIGSITKTMTAVLVLQLVAGGRLALATPIGEVLPEVPYPDRTVADLLSHAAGVPAEPAGAWWERAGRSTEFAELVAAEAGRQPVLSAGTRFHYSNLAFALLGEAVARVRGTTWWEAVRTSLLAPLGMARTSWQPTGTAASGWSVHPHTGALLPEPHSDTGAMAPAGQLWSTVGDLARWGQFLLDGHPEVLSAEQLTAAYVPRSATFPRAMDAAHGLGFLVAARPGGGEGALVGHTGSMPGFLATCLVDRSHGTVAIALANGTSGLDTVGFGARLLEVLEEVEPSLPVPWRPSHPAPAAVAEVLGRWYWGAVPHDLNWEGRELVVRGPGGAVSYRYRVDDTGIVGTHGYQDAEPLHVVRRADGSVSHLDLATFVLTRTPYDPAAPVPGGAPS